MIYAKLLLVPRAVQIKILNVSKIKATLFSTKNNSSNTHCIYNGDKIRLEQKRSPLRCPTEHFLYLTADFECPAL